MIASMRAGDPRIPLTGRGDEQCAGLQPERIARTGRFFVDGRARVPPSWHTRGAPLSSMKRIERVRLYPTAGQRRRLGFSLDVTRKLFNALLQPRRDAWRMRRYRVSSKEQYHELTALRAEEARVAAVYRECEDAVLHRLDLAFAAFFRRLKSGQTPGVPRFKSFSRWDQVEFPHGDRALKFNSAQTKVKVPGIGLVSVRKGRVVPAFGRAWLVRKGEHWYVCFECEREVTALPKTGCAIGIDRGVHVLAATSEGRLIRNPQFLERARLLIERLQRAVSRKRRGREKPRKAGRLLARAPRQGQ